MDVALAALALAGFAAASIAFTFNLETPFQPGPWPFFGGLAVGVMSSLVLLVRHIVWR